MGPHDIAYTRGPMGPYGIQYNKQQYSYVVFPDAIYGHKLYFRLRKQQQRRRRRCVCLWQIVTVV